MGGLKKKKEKRWGMQKNCDTFYGMHNFILNKIEIFMNNLKKGDSTLNMMRTNFSRKRTYSKSIDLVPSHDLRCSQSWFQNKDTWE